VHFNEIYVGKEIIWKGSYKKGSKRKIQKGFYI
jgi:hypothetical protein